MELSAIYHRPESEYAYLYKDKKLHIRIRTKKGDIESINLHYGDPFIFTEDYLLEKEAVALASNCQELENQLVISPDGFVIF
ncbi:neopullulanase [Streptococcus pneumoniae]|nr:neopullulanase [Streptococcus pneumoniae]